VTAELLVAPLLSLLLGYLLGSIPFGILLTRIAGAGDLRSIGSGNIGATNVLRTGRKGLAALTLLLDGLKGTAAVILVGAIWPGNEGLAAVGALLGHLYPTWIGFRGGKGVATFVGIMAALHWPSAIIYALVWIAALALTRFSSVAGMAAALVRPGRGRSARPFRSRAPLSRLRLAYRLEASRQYRAAARRRRAAGGPPL
jgi:glycerol-3-phosphate acyltransferase PlsY